MEINSEQAAFLSEAISTAYDTLSVIEAFEDDYEAEFIEDLMEALDGAKKADSYSLTVTTKKRTGEERTMILVGLRMVKGVYHVYESPHDPKEFVVSVSGQPHMSVSMAIVVIEGVVKTRIHDEEEIPF